MASMRDSTEARARWEDSAEEPTERDLFPSQRDDAGWIQSKQPVSALVRTIEGDVIPRLLLAHKGGPDPALPVEAASQVPTQDDVTVFTQHVLEDDVSVALAYANALLAKGVSLEGLFLELFAPTARRLGEMWVADLCDFTQVTIGVGRLQQLLREFSRSFRVDLGDWEPGRRALLAPTPGEQHSFGMLIVGEFLRRAGWDVTGEPAASRNDLCALVGGEWFAVIGLSLSCEDRLGALMRDIQAIRRASRNDSLGVIVGGRVFDEHPEFVRRVGADATAINGHEAVNRAEEFLAQTAAGG